MSLHVVVFGLTGCLGASLGDGTLGEDGWEPPLDARACPSDPDAFIGGDPTLVECPDYWTCEDLATGTKRCSNPGPDYPGGGDWECHDEGGATVCEGDSYPDDGGGGDWDCTREGDLVVCRDDTPDLPDGGGGGGWDCAYWNEFRVCDDDGGDEPGYPDDGGDVCFSAVDDPTSEVLVRGGYYFETLAGRDVIHVALIFSDAFVDNSYGVNSSDGYGRREEGHRFRDLVSSDHAEVGFRDASGAEVLLAKLDYFTDEGATTSGYDALGVSGGDGRVLDGDGDALVAASSSLDRNFNELGCVFTEDSPTADECPEWENRVIYDVWLDADAFAGGFGGVTLEYVHASPSRTDNTVIVHEGECP
ncbi:MAG: hypothetical protein JRH11_04825 [Deltaproteobacteria bacterium]|nr:hypothetical protein [Deltaproteobacteria bacterium]